MRLHQGVIAIKLAIRLFTLIPLFSACTLGQPSNSTPMSSPTFISISTPTSSPKPFPTLTAIPLTVTPKPHPGFEVNGKPFQFLGAFIPGWYWGRWSEANDIAIVTQAKQAGFTVFHLMSPPYEEPLGSFHEAWLERLDHFMDVAYQNGMYVIFPFVQGLSLAVWTGSPFYNPGGIEGLIHQPELQEGFKQHMETLITRVNSINGRKYSEDPTILSWMIIEEFVSASFNYPNGFPNVTAAEIADWIQENAVYIKSLDANHLVSIHTTGAVETFSNDALNQDWKPIFTAPALDFIEVEDAEARIRDHPEWMSTFDTLYTLNKPIVMMVSFTGGDVDQDKYCNDYQWQADAIQQVVDLYLKKGAAGFTIFSWRANTYASPNSQLCYSYSIDNLEIMSALNEVAGKLGERNIPPNPLDFVGLVH